MWEKDGGVYSRVLMEKSLHHVLAREQVPAGDTADLLLGKQYVCGYYIVRGSVCAGEAVFGKDTLIWFTGGKNFPVQTHGAQWVYIETMRLLDQEELSLQVFDEEKIPWSRPLCDGITASRHMIRAEDFGVKIQTCVYTKGFSHERHSHTAAHGFYVLEGMLWYQTGESPGMLYGPGEFAVSSPGEEMLHEQAEGCAGCRYLFIGGGPFDFIVNGVDTYHK